jgi:4-hydroxy-tetrahydrodipicolinate synthase
VIANTGTYNTAASVALTKEAQEVGCDAVMAVTPYYSKPPQEGLYRHFTAIADASDLPLMVYNIPGRTARLIEVDTLARLAEHPGIVAVKDAVGNLSFTNRTAEACGDALAIYSGNDDQTLPIIAAGGVGVVSVASHLAGPQINRLVTAALQGDLGTATKLHQALVPLASALFIEPSPMPVKAALNDLWGPVGSPRLPLVEASPETLAIVRDAVARAQQA